MKNIIFLLLILALLFSCKENTKTNDVTEQVEEVIVAKTYPETISKIIDAHGGIEDWDSLENLVFEIQHPEGNEKTSTALKSRKSLIETDLFRIGYNGKEVWLHQSDTIAFKGNAKFYYNLFFYFYAMPFVLGDEGITYKDVEPLLFEGKEYPGIQISYNSGIGESPEDEYILYYNANTNKMVWLGYTVTFFSKEKTKDFHLIKYDDWQMVNDLLLPKTFKWYGFENKIVGELQKEMHFVNVSTSIEKLEDSLFERPVDAKVID